MKSAPIKLVNVVKEILYLLVTLVGEIFRSKPKPPKAPEKVQNLAEAEAYLEALAAFGTPPGLSLAVVKDNEMIYSKAFGLADGPKKVPATTETVFKWWSVTKIITAAAILQLHEKKKLNIDDPVLNYLPFFDVVYPSEHSEVVTVRHLLNHSSGLPDNMPAVLGWMHFEDTPQLDQTALLEKILPDYKKLKFEPGDHSEYTNVGYMVLGSIIEAVSGTTYQEYIVENIFEPLGMNHTNFLYTDEMLPLAAAGSHPIISLDSALLPFFYGDLSELIREKTEGKIWFKRFFADSDPPTGMIAPAPDLARFMLAYLNDGELNGTRILSAETVKMMTYDSHIASTKKGQGDKPIAGLGWGIHTVGERMAIVHSGGGPGFGSLMCLFPEESLGFVIVANDTTHDRVKIIELFASLDW